MTFEFETMLRSVIRLIDTGRFDRIRCSVYRIYAIVYFYSVPSFTHAVTDHMAEIHSIHLLLVGDVEFEEGDVQIRDRCWEFIRVGIGLEISVSEILVVRKLVIPL